MSISVDENNPYLCSVDGVLFSKDGNTLIRYPSLVKGDYTVPEVKKSGMLFIKRIQIFLKAVI